MLLNHNTLYREEDGVDEWVKKVLQLKPSILPDDFVPKPNLNHGDVTS